MRIRTEALKATLGTCEILKAVDLDVAENTLVGIIGPNGSGKTTLLRCIYRTLKPTGGAVYLEDTRLEAMSIRESAGKLAVVAQHNYYNFEFTVREVVMMGRSPHKRLLDRETREDLAIVDEVLRTVGLTEFAERLFSSLSGGEQQRVILARALAQQTPCLILDEPTNHLDIKYQLWVMNLVRSLSKTVIAAIHDLNIGAMYCDQLYAMKDGKIVGSGTPKELLTPEFIRDLYEVHAHIIEGKDGRIRILYE